MKRRLTEEDIRKIFTDPNSLRKTLVLWKTAEKRGYKLVRRMINERKGELERCGEMRGETKTLLLKEIEEKIEKGKEKTLTHRSGALQTLRQSARA